MEVNFDGLIGPTHHYGGLAFGNLASTRYRHQPSHPRAAALQGLSKMKLLADLGIPQAVLPPHPRPHWPFLSSNGFVGSESDVIDQVSRRRPELLSVAYSSSFMWAANSATVSPSADTMDGRIHITAANLRSSLHRSLEGMQTAAILRQIFADPKYFVIYDPLPNDPVLADEGAANHNRLCRQHGEQGVELFVYGREGEENTGLHPSRFPARQSRLASERVAALHELLPESRLFVQQNPEAIDAGVFHNDVIAVANETVLLYHEKAFLSSDIVLQELRSRLGEVFTPIVVREDELTVEEAVNTYLFNSQLITLPSSSGESEAEHEMLLLCPTECESHPRVRKVIDRILSAANPISRVEYVDVRESMQNGGGPACLRLRVALTPEEQGAVHRGVFLTPALYDRLVQWVNRHYRDQLSPDDLRDPKLVQESRSALEELSEILGLRCC